MPTLYINYFFFLMKNISKIFQKYSKKDLFFICFGYIINTISLRNKVIKKEKREKKMKLKTIETYKFKELSNEVKEKLIDTYLQDSYESLGEDFEYHAKEIIKDKLGIEIEDAEVYYSLSYCQGDGVSFEGESIKIEKLLSNYKDKFSKRELRLLNLLGDNLYIDAIRNNSNCYHENTMSIQVSGRDDYYSYEIIEGNLYSIADKVTEIARDLCQELERIGYSYFDNVHDFAKHDLIERDEDFTKNGEIID